MIRKFFVSATIVFFVLCSGLFAKTKGPATPSIYVSSDWKQGGIGSLFVYPTDGISNVRVTLKNAKGEITADTQAYPYTVKMDKKKSAEVLLSLVGLSPEYAAGIYQLVVSGEEKSGVSFSLGQSVTIAAKEYPHITIRMGPQGQRASQNRSRQRAEEAKRFWAALNEFNPKDVFHPGVFIWPVREKWRFSSTFGEKRDFIYPNGSRGHDIHNGQDLAGLPVGVPVYAPAAGRVMLAEKRILTGNTVIIEHLPATFSLYYHMDELSTKKGDFLKQGDPVGTVGATGFATGPHLHFGVNVGGLTMDPAYLMSQPLVDEVFIKKTIENLL